MKLFKSLLVAPATIGLLAPISAFAGEANLNDISKYSNLEHLDLANAFVNDEPKNNSLLAGGEGLVDSGSSDGGFSQTTTASFSVDTVIGALDVIQLAKKQLVITNSTSVYQQVSQVKIHLT